MALESQDLSKNAKLAIKFRRSEKLLLLNAMSFCKKIKEKLSRESPEEK